MGALPRRASRFRATIRSAKARRSRSSVTRFTRPRRLAEGNAIVDEAAVAAGRSPADVRRLLNLGEPLSAEAVAELVLERGGSGLTLLTDDAHLIRWYGEELAPAVRESVTRERTARPG